VLKQSLEEETEYHNTAVARLNGELEQIKRRMNQAYLDKARREDRRRVLGRVLGAVAGR